jgi:thymidylate synthase ThyX
VINAKVLAHSTTEKGKEVISFEVEYPRFIHSEVMTHRMFSRNAASSRAIPVEAVIEQVRTAPAMPIHWGKNQPGMQAKEELSGVDLVAAKDDWLCAAMAAASIAERLSLYGLHKQVVNRILEPYVTMKTVITATEMDNFYWLRCHEDAQPEIKALAEAMRDAQEDSTPQVLYPGEYHLPYVKNLRDCFGNLMYFVNGTQVSLEDAIKVSASCCAQVSYRKLDEGIDKATMIYGKLVESEPVHASPFEHQATPLEEYQVGVTHTDKEGNLCSGNFVGWLQHRQLIPNNVYKGG